MREGKEVSRVPEEVYNRLVRLLVKRVLVEIKDKREKPAKKKIAR
jgi:hypothetical protein